MKRPPRIGVSGAGDATATEVEVATRLGAALARRGAVVVCGGLGGVMTACARGAHEAGGLTIGILPGADAGAANPWITVPVVTDMGHARNVILVHSAEALVAVGGSYGTLSEVALALKIGVPVAALGSWQPERAGHPPPPITVLDDPEAAAAWAITAAARTRG
jgi:uncharacterized protein (TIGR00725 family)